MHAKYIHEEEQDKMKRFHSYLLSFVVNKIYRKTNIYGGNEKVYLARLRMIQSREWIVANVKRIPAPRRKNYTFRVSL